MSEPSTVKRLVAKFGTAILTHANGRLNEDLIRRWVDLLSDLCDEGREILIVSSGAIGAGMGELNLDARPKNLPDIQALAAVGQSRLMSVYSEAFLKRGYHVAQILLTRGDLDDRRRHLNIRNTLQRLLAMRIIPIINENDSVSVDELCFGDNDILSAIMASKIQADLLVMFTDVEGLYESDPRTDPQSKVRPLITSVDREVEEMASRTTSALGSGGMRSKILAARAALLAGIPTVIAFGRDPENLRRILSGESIGTRFQPTGGGLSGRDRWIALGANSSARKVLVDAGAKRALIDGKKSLLPAGVTGVSGEFEKGDVVEICDEKGVCFAKGLSNYSSAEVSQIKGRRTADIVEILGENRYDEVVHRDNMVVLETN
jgi:glutamate 5-kinase